jgi:hypothetical protein
MGHEPSGVLFFLYLLIEVLFGLAGAGVARRRGRGPLIWFFVCFCFTWIGLVILFCLPKWRVTVSLIPRYDQAKWQALVASNADVAAAVEKLAPYGKYYVDDLASAVLGAGSKQDRPAAIARVLEKATGHAAIVADDAWLDSIGRNVHSLYRTDGGLLAQIIDGTVLAQNGSDVRLFRSSAEYRRFYSD